MSYRFGKNRRMVFKPASNVDDDSAFACLRLLVFLTPASPMSVGSEEISDHGNQENLDGAKQTPLPLLQLFSVSLIQIAEPITALCIYPFINQFIRDTGITGGDERKTGYYGGIIVRSGISESY